MSLVAISLLHCVKQRRMSEGRCLSLSLSRSDLCLKTEKGTVGWGGVPLFSCGGSVSTGRRGARKMLKKKENETK